MISSGFKEYIVMCNDINGTISRVLTLSTRGIATAMVASVLYGGLAFAVEGDMKNNPLNNVSAIAGGIFDSTSATFNSVKSSGDSFPNTGNIVLIDSTKGIIYAAELFSETAEALPVGKYVAARYIISGNIQRPAINVTFTLNNSATFGGPVGLAIAPGSSGLVKDTTTVPGVTTRQGGIDCRDVLSATADNPTGTVPAGPQAGTGVNSVSVASTGGGNNASSVTYEIRLQHATDSPKDADDGAVPCKIADGAELLLLYTLNAPTLKTAGEKVTLTATFTDVGGPGIPNPTRSVDIAQSKQGVTANITKPTGVGYLSAALEKKEFDTTLSTNPPVVDKTNAVIGYISLVGIVGVKDKSGDDFTLADLSLSDASSSTLVISGGQFAASLGGAEGGRVYIAGGTEINATSVTASEATFTFGNVTPSPLTSISDMGINGAAIRMVINGTTAVNDVATDPLATLTLNLSNGSNILLEDKPLLKFKPAGTECIVYNVPPPSENASDALSIRVTNNSSKEVALTGTMYNLDGTVAFSSQDLLAGKKLAPYATQYLDSQSIVSATGVSSWSGRAVLVIFSQSSDIEVLAMLRSQHIVLQNGQKGGDLSNISTGATGSSCTTN